MQHRKVVSWLSQHNFPHGLVSFADGLSTDPLGHKAAYLSNLIQVMAGTAQDSALPGEFDPGPLGSGFCLVNLTIPGL